MSDYYEQPVYSRATRNTTGESKRPQKKERKGWCFPTVIGMVIFLLLIVVGNLVMPWIQTTWDDFHYGRPRTTQYNVVVGHNDDPPNNYPSHFVAINLNRQIIIIEYPGGKAKDAKSYQGPLMLGPGQDLATPFLSFADLDGDHRIDMTVKVQEGRAFFINQGDSFRPLRTGEKISV
ncbi:MAG TPA: hypothetical protein VLG12_03260 [Candidatus Saccharimonadales bacterium]|nr:hypothetical protein [Candidatus Saccharimonadales bacterium]